MGSRIAVRPRPESDLLMRYYPLARMIARRTHARIPSGVDADDLVSAAVMGLMDAVEVFDPTRGIAFKSFAKHRIQGAVLDSLRATDWIPRAVRRRAEGISRARTHLRGKLGREPDTRDLAGYLGVDVVELQSTRYQPDLRPVLSLDAACTDEPDGESLIQRVPGEGSPESHLENADLKRIVADAVAALPERERAVIVLSYFRDLTLREAGEVLGVTESRACQICAQAIRRLKLRLRTVPL